MKKQYFIRNHKHLVRLLSSARQRCPLPAVKSSAFTPHSSSFWLARGSLFLRLTDSLAQPQAPNLISFPVVFYADGLQEALLLPALWRIISSPVLAEVI
jgi:hypothetical protein